MDFLEITSDEVLIVHGAAVGMSLGPDGEMFYVLRVVGGDYHNVEKYVTFAIPPQFTEQFVQIINGMAPKRE